VNFQKNIGSSKEKVSILVHGTMQIYTAKSENKYEFCRTAKYDTNETNHPMG